MDPPEIQKWTYDFSLRIIKLCAALDEDRVGRILLSRLLRARTAIGANVEQAQGTQSKKDFISNISIARKESFETHYRFRLLRDSQILPEVRVANIIDR